MTGFLRAAALAEAHSIQVSGHCAPGAHAHVATATPNLRHLEYFHDHQRIEALFFDGMPGRAGGVLTPDLTSPGMGVAFRAPDAARYRTA